MEGKDLTFEEIRPSRLPPNTPALPPSLVKKIGGAGRAASGGRQPRPRARRSAVALYVVFLPPDAL